jgi:hypothetical protein
MKRHTILPVSDLRLLQIGTVMLLAGLLAGCATTGSTWGSGVGDTQFGQPPYAAGARPLQGATFAVLPILWQRGATQPELFDPASGTDTEVAGLLDDMNAYLMSLDVGVVIRTAPQGTPPDVRFGCERSPDDECDEVDDRRPHTLAVGRPSRSWVDWASAEAAAAGVDYVVVITLETGNYVPRQRNLLGSKEVVLGTGHTKDVPWLTATDRPASVLQVTGAVVAGDGIVRRIAAEGLLVRPTNVVLAGFGAQRLISDEDVRELRSARRTDLDGAPLTWQVALQNLLISLMGS